MARTIFWSYKSPDSTAMLNDWLRGIVPAGVYVGMTVQPGSSGMKISILTEVDPDNPAVNLGKLRTKEGAVIEENADLVDILTGYVGDLLNPRIDYVVATYVYTSSDPPSDVTYQVLQGTAGITPTPPTLNANQTLLAELHIPAGTTTLLTSHIFNVAKESFSIAAAQLAPVVLPPGVYSGYRIRAGSASNKVTLGAGKLLTKELVPTSLLADAVDKFTLTSTSGPTAYRYDVIVALHKNANISANLPEYILVPGVEANEAAGGVASIPTDGNILSAATAYNPKYNSQTYITKLGYVRAQGIGTSMIVEYHHFSRVFEDYSWVVSGGKLDSRTTSVGPGAHRWPYVGHEGLQSLLTLAQQAVTDYYSGAEEHFIQDTSISIQLEGDFHFTPKAAVAIPSYIKLLGKSAPALRFPADSIYPVNVIQGGLSVTNPDLGANKVVIRGSFDGVSQTGVPSTYERVELSIPSTLDRGIFQYLTGGLADFRFCGNVIKGDPIYFVYNSVAYEGWFEKLGTAIIPTGTWTFTAILPAQAPSAWSGVLAQYCIGKKRNAVDGISVQQTGTVSASTKGYYSTRGCQDCFIGDIRVPALDTSVFENELTAGKIEVTGNGVQFQGRPDSAYLIKGRNNRISSLVLRPSYAVAYVIGGSGLSDGTGWRDCSIGSIDYDGGASLLGTLVVDLHAGTVGHVSCRRISAAPSIGGSSSSYDSVQINDVGETFPRDVNIIGSRNNISSVLVNGATANWATSATKNLISHAYTLTPMNDNSTAKDNFVIYDQIVIATGGFVQAALSDYCTAVNAPSYKNEVVVLNSGLYGLTYNSTTGWLTYGGAMNLSTVQIGDTYIDGQMLSLRVLEVDVAGYRVRLDAGQSPNTTVGSVWDGSIVRGNVLMLNTALSAYSYTPSTGAVVYSGSVVLSHVSRGAQNGGYLFVDGAGNKFEIQSINVAGKTIYLETYLDISTAVSDSNSGSVVTNNNPRSLSLNDMRFIPGIEDIPYSKVMVNRNRTEVGKVYSRDCYEWEDERVAVYKYDLPAGTTTSAATTSTTTSTAPGAPAAPSAPSAPAAPAVSPASTVTVATAAAVSAANPYIGSKQLLTLDTGLDSGCYLDSKRGDVLEITAYMTGVMLGLANNLPFPQDNITGKFGLKYASEMMTRIPRGSSNPAILRATKYGAALSYNGGYSWFLNDQVPGYGAVNMENGTFYNCGAGPAKWITVGVSGNIYTSPVSGDPVWTSRSSGVSNTLHDVVGTNDKLAVAVGQVGTITSSADGVTWVNHSVATLNHFYSICWQNFGAGSVYVAVGSNGIIYSSTDGITWTAQTSGTANYLYCVCATSSKMGSAGARVVACGDGGNVTIGAAGSVASWSTVNVGTSAILVGIAHGMGDCTGSSATGRYVAVGMGGVLAYTDDFSAATGWVVTTSPEEFHGISYIPETGRFMAQGISGKSYYSYDGVEWLEFPNEDLDVITASSPTSPSVIIDGHAVYIPIYGSAIDTSVMRNRPQSALQSGPSIYNLPPGVHSVKFAFGSSAYVTHVYILNQPLNGYFKENAGRVWLGGQFYDYPAQLTAVPSLVGSRGGAIERYANSSGKHWAFKSNYEFATIGTSNSPVDNSILNVADLSGLSVGDLILVRGNTSGYYEEHCIANIILPTTINTVTALSGTFSAGETVAITYRGKSLLNVSPHKIHAAESAAHDYSLADAAYANSSVYEDSTAAGVPYQVPSSSNQYLRRGVELLDGECYISGYDVAYESGFSNKYDSASMVIKNAASAASLIFGFTGTGVDVLISTPLCSNDADIKVYIDNVYVKTHKLSTGVLLGSYMSEDWLPLAGDLSYGYHTVMLVQPASNVWYPYVRKYRVYEPKLPAVSGMKLYSYNVPATRGTTYSSNVLTPYEGSVQYNPGTFVSSNPQGFGHGSVIKQVPTALAPTTRPFVLYSTDGTIITIWFYGSAFTLMYNVPYGGGACSVWTTGKNGGFAAVSSGAAVLGFTVTGSDTLDTTVGNGKRQSWVFSEEGLYCIYLTRTDIVSTAVITGYEVFSKFHAIDTYPARSVLAGHRRLLQTAKDLRTTYPIETDPLYSGGQLKLYDRVAGDSTYAANAEFPVCVNCRGGIYDILFTARIRKMLSTLTDSVRIVASLGSYPVSEYIMDNLTGTTGTLARFTCRLTLPAGRSCIVFSVIPSTPAATQAGAIIVTEPIVAWQEVARA